MCIHIQKEHLSMNAQRAANGSSRALNPVPPDSVLGVERSAPAQATLARILSQPAMRHTTLAPHQAPASPRLDTGRVSAA